LNKKQFSVKQGSPTPSLKLGLIVILKINKKIILKINNFNEFLRKKKHFKKHHIS
jgi:hypothetical protein